MTVVQSNQKIRNPKLLELLKSLTKALIDALDKPFVPDYGSWYDRIKIILERDPDLLAKILEKRPELQEKRLSMCLLLAEKCLQALLAEDICRNKRHASTLEEHQDELALFLERLFKERERERTLFANPEAFERHFSDIFQMEYLRYEKYLYDSSITDLLICPLQNFICSKSKHVIELGGKSVIRKITQDEFHSLVEAENRYGRELHELESYPEFVLCIPIEGNDWQEQIESLIISLRLLKEEGIGLSRIYFAYALPFRPWNIMDTPPGTKFVGKQSGEFFDFKDSDDLGLNAILALVNKTRKVGYLNVSMRRFNFAHERERLEDCWIDYFVSLESLYSKESEMTEVTHRLATRVSRALGSDPFGDRTKIRGKMKEWYGIRSKIVHGTNVQLEQEQMKNLEKVLRDSLKWFMNQKECADHDKIIDLLDLG